MQLSVAVAKVNRWAARESGDTFEMVERPGGGLSFVLVDGQSSGSGAKAVGMLVMRKVISDLAEGVRDGAAARAANDMLYTRRRGRVSATLVILSAELDSGMLIVTRCGNSAVFIRSPGGDAYPMEAEAPALGFYRHTRPAVDKVMLEPGLVAVACTDGLVHAGSRSGTGLYVPEAVERIWQANASADGLADGLLDMAVTLDDGRPSDDTSVVVLHAQSGPNAGPRRMHVEMPVPDR
jgi:serine phosphatase RsbU (regulator of sigma subunit)